MGVFARLLRGPLPLVLAVALIAVGASSLVRQNTVAFFTEQTNNAGNTFATQQITFDNTVNGGAACTAGPGTTNNPKSCSALVTISNMVPGDSKLGKIKLDTPSGATESPVTLWLGVTATTSSALDSTAVGSGGLGLLLFTCFSGSSTTPATVSTVADCETAPGAGNSLYLLPTYPTPTTCTNMGTATAKNAAGVATPTFQLAANTALATALISTPNNAANQNVSIVGNSATAVCTGGSIVTATQVPIGGPDAVTGIINTGATAQAQGLLAGDADYLAAIAYLPTSAGNALQNLTSTLQFSWTAEQKAGSSQ